jgi:hypothetical protein
MADHGLDVGTTAHLPGDAMGIPRTWPLIKTFNRSGQLWPQSLCRYGCRRTGHLCFLRPLMTGSKCGRRRLPSSALGTMTGVPIQASQP